MQQFARFGLLIGMSLVPAYLGLGRGILLLELCCMNCLLRRLRFQLSQSPPLY